MIDILVYNNTLWKACKGYVPTIINRSCNEEVENHKDEPNFIVTLTFITSHKTAKETQHLQRNQENLNPTANTRYSTLKETTWLSHLCFHQVFKHIIKARILSTPKLRDNLDSNSDFFSLRLFCQSQFTGADCFTPVHLFFTTSDDHN